MRHTIADGVPTIIPEAIGYKHQYVLFAVAQLHCLIHTTQRDRVLEFLGPRYVANLLAFRYVRSSLRPIALTTTVKQCQGEEDPTCSDSIPSSGINVAHTTYFGQGMFDTFIFYVHIKFISQPQTAIALDPTVCV